MDNEKDITLDTDPLSFSPYEDIGACSMAIGSISEFDSAMMGEDERQLIEEIKFMCLRIIHSGIKEIYQSNCYGEEEDAS